jgi:hydroxyethylthiazole kinase
MPQAGPETNPTETPDLSPSGVLAAIRRRRPLVHNITNAVVMNSTANGLLAIGASPIMAHAPEEVAEIVAIAQSLVINIGTITRSQAEAMDIAASAAATHGKPWVLDPVGVGATALRRSTGERLVRGRPSVIRGNASEIGTLAGDPPGGRGVDASSGATFAGHDAARRLARQSGCVVAVTGVVDLVTDGTRDSLVHNGHPILARITGTGCLASALVGAALGAGAPAFEAAVAALVVLGIAGENAAQGEAGPGTAQVRLFDLLASLAPAEIADGQRLS